VVFLIITYYIFLLSEKFEKQGTEIPTSTRFVLTKVKYIYFFFRKKGRQMLRSRSERLMHVLVN
jgi:hypothetical protein